MVWSEWRNCGTCPINWFRIKGFFSLFYLIFFFYVADGLPVRLPIDRANIHCPPIIAYIPAFAGIHLYTYSAMHTYGSTRESDNVLRIIFTSNIYFFLLNVLHIHHHNWHLWHYNRFLLRSIGIRDADGNVRSSLRLPAAGRPYIMRVAVPYIMNVHKTWNIFWSNELLKSVIDIYNIYIWLWCVRTNSYAQAHTATPATQ